MTPISTYLAMGGYAAYVWPAYAIAAAVFGGLAFHSWRRYRASWRGLERMQRQSDRRQSSRRHSGRRRQ